MKQTVKVTNTGRQTRERLGKPVKPKETVEFEVNQRQLLTLKAVRDFVVEEEEEELVEPELNYSNLNMEEVLQAVKDGKLTVEEAIAKEISGKNRSTLLDKLEELKEQ